MTLWFAKQWRVSKLFLALMIIEFPLTIACLTLVGVAHPNTYRTKLWQNGFDEGFNSAPNSILYAYANWETPTVPIVWAQATTEFNVVISVFSMFVLLVKSAMYVMHIFIPAISVVAHAVLVAIYAVSIYKQSRSDMSDPDHPSPGLPWYLSKGCGSAEPGNKGFCMQAQGTFGVVIVMFSLFAVYLGYSIWSAIPTEHEKAQHEAERETDMEMRKISMYGGYGDDAPVDEEEGPAPRRGIFLNLPKTPNTPGFGMKNPMTPRTTAFTQLTGGQVPKTPRVQVTAIAGPSRTLPFRDMSGTNDEE